MNYRPNGPIVAKFGGTSNARPDLIEQRLAELNTHGGEPGILVMSAAGKDPAYRDKMTDLLRSCDREGGQQEITIALARQAQVASLTSLPSELQHTFLRQLVRDVEQFRQLGNPHEPLGEKWSTDLNAMQTGREAVYGDEFTHFRRRNVLDDPGTTRAIRDRFQPGRQYVAAGYYGRLPNGEITTFSRGGSDVTGALVARALGASLYQNWSDVAGFLAADPGVYDNPQLISHMTYGEAREFANGGTPLLHPEVPRILNVDGIDIPTMMCNTFTGAQGTLIERARDDIANRPVVGISGQSRLLEISSAEYGIEEEYGATVKIFNALKRHKLAYKNAGTGVDDLSIYLDWSQENEERLRQIFNKKGQSIRETSSLHLVGEGLLDPVQKTKILAKVTSVLGKASIGIEGTTNVRHSRGLTLFVSPEEYSDANRLLHDEIVL